MKIVLWVGNESNQKALANKLHSLFPIAGIISETRQHKSSFSISNAFGKIFEKIFLPSIGKAWWGMKLYYDKYYPEFPKTDYLDVENINSPKAFEFTRKIAPDLIVVSGTRLIREKMLSLQPAYGILNLHTGLSPYIKGGPNCTNWCLATEQFHLIGNTIMWIDKGIDSGNIVTTEFTEFSGNENLAEIHMKVMEHAHKLYLKAISFIFEGGKSNVKQSDIAEGKTYYNRQWGLNQKLSLIRNLKKFRQLIISGKQLASKRNEIKIVKLNHVYS